MSRFRSNDYWRPLGTVWAKLPNVGHPLTERFAIDLFYHTSTRELPATLGEKGTTTWEHARPETREAFRERARRLMWGDLSVLPTYLPPAYGAWQAILAA